MKDQNEVLLLIDSHAIIHRAYHAYPATLKTLDGRQINAVYGFTSILLDVLKEFNPKYVVCTYDEKGPTLRHEKFKEYKGTRKEVEIELIEQFPLVHEVVDAFNIPMIGANGYEADDILGTISKLEMLPKKIIVTGDKDLFQLVNGNIKVYIQGSKFNKAKLYDTNGVKEKMGFGPEYVTDYKALRGDSSDNIPGVKGIGDKTATQLINEFGSLDQIYEHIVDIKSKSTQEKLIRDKDTAYLSKDLATIITNVPIPFELSKCELSDFNPEKVKQLFIKFGFKSLMKRIPESNGIVSEISQKEPIQSQKIRNEGSEQTSMFGSKIEKPESSEKVRTNVEYKILRSKNEIEKFINDLSKQKTFAFDCETTGLDFMNAQVLGISFSWKEGSGYYLDLASRDLSEAHVSNLKEIFEDPKIKKIGHNIKFDSHVLHNKAISGINLGIRLQNYHFDTLIAAYILNGGRRGIGLKTLAFNELGMEMLELDEVWKSVEGYKAKLNYTKEVITDYMLRSDQDLLARYACADADATFRLYELYSSKLELPGLRANELFFKIEIPIIEVLVEMEREGILLDKGYLISYGKELDGKLSELKKGIFSVVESEFNIDSPKQVGEVLFNNLKLGGGRKTKTGAWQTNEKILNDLVNEHPIVPIIIEYRELAKLRSTYVDSLINEVNENTKRIHTNYNQTIASTGRLSSSNPNLQNIPVSTEEGLKIRKAFVAPKNRTFISFDISQQELRILAHFSGEDELIKAFKNNVDIHILTASKVFNIDIDKVTKEQRGIGKTLNFSLIYGISEFGLSERLKISRSEAKELIDSYFRTYPKIKRYFDEILIKAKEENKVETMFGRFRDTSGLSNSNFQIRSATTREVINFPIQGTAADMIKISMIECHKYLQNSDISKTLNAKMILQIHDELVFEVDDSTGKEGSDRIEQFKEEITEIMERAVKLIVPVKVSTNTSKNWGELK